MTGCLEEDRGAVPGRDLSRRFYERAVRSLVVGVPHAAALLGEGSEVLGFDDEVSTDHDFGPPCTTRSICSPRGVGHWPGTPTTSGATSWQPAGCGSARKNRSSAAQVAAAATTSARVCLPPAWPATSYGSAFLLERLGLAEPVDPAPRRFHSRDIHVLGAERLTRAPTDAISDPPLRTLLTRLGHGPDGPLAISSARSTRPPTASRAGRTCRGGPSQASATSPFTHTSRSTGQLCGASTPAATRSVQAAEVSPLGSPSVATFSSLCCVRHTGGRMHSAATSHRSNQERSPLHHRTPTRSATTSLLRLHNATTR